MAQATSSITALLAAAGYPSLADDADDFPSAADANFGTGAESIASVEEGASGW